MKLLHCIAVLCGVMLCISACVDLSSSSEDESSLTCEPLTRNARGDIDPVPSPDGQYVAYRRMTDASPEVGELHYMSFDDPVESHALLKAGEFHGGASWSPDGEWISYTVFERKDPNSALVNNSVYKVNIRTNEKIRLVDGWRIPRIGEYTSWTESNEIYFATPDAFYLIDPQGGTPRTKLVIDMDLQDAPMHLAAGPRGKSIAFSVDTRDSDDTALRRRSGIWLANLEAGQIVQLTHDSPDSFPVWQDAGTILFLRELSQPGKLSLHSLVFSTGRIASIGTPGIVYSISTIPDQTELFAATADRWDLSGNDFNFFRGFSIARCNLPIWSGVQMAGLTKQVWEKASTDLGIRVVAPYDLILPSGSRIRASVLVKDFGAAQGMLIVDSFELVGRHHEEILASGYGYSVLDSPKTADAYDRESTMIMLRDWSWTGQEGMKPDWLTE